MMTSIEGTFLEIPLSEIGESYGRLRLVHPQADASMVDSLRKFGQIFPVVVTQRYELIDGFKRVRALKRLGFERVTARVLALSVHGLKAAMIYLNWKKGPICDLEEGMVVHSLCREDGLSQVEVAVLLGRHKSWVCRRLSLIERLCDEALEHMRLGLIRGVTGRELARLPRGNQEAALHTILKYRFSSRESARLVSLLLSRPRWNWQNLLNFPGEILSDRVPERPRSLSPLDALTKKLLQIRERLLSMAEQCDEDMRFECTKEECSPVSCALEKVRETLDSFKDRIDGIRMRAE
jgi:ParB-like chromosome segregation protein Spo0J